MPQDLAPSIASEPQAIAGLVVILVLSLSWHEAAHAWVADRLGDPTARELGRVSLNPLRHLDPFLSVLLPAMLIIAGSPIVFGGGKPVPINVMNFRHRARDFMFVALAGPGSNLLLAVLAGALFVACAWAGLLPPIAIHDPYVDGGQRLFTPSIMETSASLLPYFLQMAVLLNLVLAIFNLMPIPPLDGSRLVGWLLPRPLQPRWYALDRIGLILVIVVVFFLGGQEVLGRAVEVAFTRLGGVIDALTGLVVT